MSSDFKIIAGQVIPALNISLPFNCEINLEKIFNSNIPNQSIKVYTSQNGILFIDQQSSQQLVDIHWANLIQIARNCSEQNVTLNKINGQFQLCTTRTIEMDEILKLWPSHDLLNEWNIPDYLQLANFLSVNQYKCIKCSNKIYEEPNQLKIHIALSCRDSLINNNLFNSNNLNKQLINNEQSLIKQSMCNNSILFQNSYQNLFKNSNINLGLNTFNLSNCNLFIKNEEINLNNNNSLNSLNNILINNTNLTNHNINNLINSTNFINNNYLNANHLINKRFKIEENNNLLNAINKLNNLNVDIQKSIDVQSSINKLNKKANQLINNQFNQIKKPKQQSNNNSDQSNGILNIELNNNNSNNNNDKYLKHPPNIDLINLNNNLSLNKNRALKATKEPRSHTCKFCGKLYTRKYGLKIHIRTHTGHKPLKCIHCSRAFSDPSNLNKHLRLHNTHRQWPPKQIEIKN